MYIVTQYFSMNTYHILYWSGLINDTRLRLDTKKEEIIVKPILFHSAMIPTKDYDTIYCCNNMDNYEVRIKYVI